jgi:hypothetical protein
MCIEPCILRLGAGSRDGLPETALAAEHADLARRRGSAGKYAPPPVPDNAAKALQGRKIGFIPQANSHAGLRQLSIRAVAAPVPGNRLSPAEE